MESSRMSEQNWLVESMNMTLLERARSMRLQEDLSEDFWAETISNACYLVNKLPSTTIDLQIPKEMQKGELVSMTLCIYLGVLPTRE